MPLCFPSRPPHEEELVIVLSGGVINFKQKRTEQDTETRDHTRSFCLDRPQPTPELYLYPKT